MWEPCRIPKFICSFSEHYNNFIEFVLFYPAQILSSAFAFLHGRDQFCHPVFQIYHQKDAQKDSTESFLQPPVGFTPPLPLSRLHRENITVQVITMVKMSV